ncbi:hypothetical protein FH972_024123 [Carpinus fangiana]|uniref:Peptidase A1 domain-containing protein n=1 Tax=Carpinus fangiana TaxID=176857 RepID=A0A5N6KX53_9ROSI|nr:hypothetical protein FH972_024123 [Carpinus fangiana]
MAVSSPTPGAPLEVQWSDKTYGPDGPWPAVTVSIGQPAQSVDLFPAGYLASNVFLPPLCAGLDGTAACTATQAGWYNYNRSRTVNTTVSWSGQHGFMAPIPMSGSWSGVTDDITLPFAGSKSTTVPSSALRISQDTYAVYPNNKYKINIGTLSLGGPVPVTNLSTVTPDVYFSAGLVPNFYANQDIIPSSSFALHIGSQAITPPIPPSLFFGGYDASRIVGPTLQGDVDYVNSTVTIADVSIEDSAEYARSGLVLSDASATIPSPLRASVEPGQPYLVLPDSICQRLTEGLPLSYDPGLSLYLWNTSSPAYTSLCSSAASLAFTLNTATSSNITVKVPFALLTNLTLEPPLVDTARPYFPCFSASNGGGYSLGRAFLQAALFGINWHTDTGLGLAVIAVIAIVLARRARWRKNADQYQQSQDEKRDAGMGAQPAPLETGGREIVSELQAEELQHELQADRPKARFELE